MNLYQKILNKIDWWYNTRLSQSVFLMPEIQVLDFENSISQLVNQKSSLARFGDGEFSLMLNGEFLRSRSISLKFQKADPLLKRRLLEVISDKNVQDYNLKIGISSAIKNIDESVFTVEACNFWKNFLIENRYKIYKLLQKKYPYVDTLISRFYMDYKDKSQHVIQQKITSLKRIWQDYDVLIVEGYGTRLGINNDLFNNVKSIQRILCPNENAFDFYDEIFKSVLQLAEQKLVILSLGPTATVLAYDLARKGLRALDLGHIDIEYEWFLQNAVTKILITEKVITEVEDYNRDLEIANLAYAKQIVKKIG